MSEKINVLLIEPGKYPKQIEIEDTLEAMQETVGGYIEEYMPFDDEVAIVCNEEGKQAVGGRGFLFELRRKNTSKRPRCVYGLRRRVAGGSRILHWLRSGDKSGNAEAGGAASNGNTYAITWRRGTGRLFRQV